METEAEPAVIAIDCDWVPVKLPALKLKLYVLVDVRPASVSPLNSATPLDVVAVRVPPSVPLSPTRPIVMVVAAAMVTVFPLAS